MLKLKSLSDTGFDFARTPKVWQWPVTSGVRAASVKIKNKWITAYFIDLQRGWPRYLAEQLEQTDPPDCFDDLGK